MRSKVCANPLRAPGNGDRAGSLGQGGAQQITFRAQQQALGKAFGGLFVNLVRRAPAALQLGFAQGFALPLADALCVVLQGRLIVAAQVQRPTAEQCLIENQLIAGRRHLIVVAQRAGEGAPQADLFGVPFTAFAQHCQARAGVFAAFVIVGRGGEQVVREIGQALGTGLMKIRHRGAELFGAEANVIARQQHRRAIERGVFHGLRRGR